MTSMATRMYGSQELLRQLQNPTQREEAFRRLMQQYGHSLYWHIRRLVVGREDAEDVLQETCIKVLGAIDSFRGDANTLVPWLYQIATREALQWLRRSTHLFQSIDALGEKLIEKLWAENGQSADEAELLLQEALLKLPTTQRMVFNMRYYDGLTYEQMALVTGKKVGTLKTNFHYASERVREYLKENIKQ